MAEDGPLEVSLHETSDTLPQKSSQDQQEQQKGGKASVPARCVSIVMSCTRHCVPVVFYYNCYMCTYM